MLIEQLTPSTLAEQESEHNKRSECEILKIMAYHDTNKSWG